MVKAIYYGPHFSEKLTEICSKGSVNGLVLGSVIEDRMFGVCLVETPKEVTEDGIEIDQEAVKKDQVLDVTWMLEHARQVSRLMPGEYSLFKTFFIPEVLSHFIVILSRWFNNFGVLYLSK